MRPLTEFSQGQIDMIMYIFKRDYLGQKNAIKSEALLLNLKGTGQMSVSPQTFRELLGHIRHNDLLKPYFIVSNVNKGYWLTKDEDELKAYLNQELERMSNQYDNVHQLRDRLVKPKDKNLQNQPSLFG